MLSFFSDPFSTDFMVRALFGVLALGISGPLCGCWVTQRRLVYLTDAMSHAILAGVAVAALIGVSLLAGAFAAAIVMTLIVAFFVLRVGIAEDSAIGITGQALLAFGVIGVSAQGDPRELTHVLFGNPLTVNGTDVLLQWIATAIVAVAVWFLYPLLIATTFDSVHARTVGIRVGLVDTAVVVGLGIVVVVGLSTVGVLMAVAMIVAPATAARLLTQRMSSMMPLAVVFGVCAGVVGLVISYHASLPTGPVIALCTVAEVVAAAALAHRTRRPSVSLVADRPGDHA
jgi:ABC-type Mn2+/Zn2+ transport system permease subunit